MGLILPPFLGTTAAFTSGNLDASTKMVAFNYTPPATTPIKKLQVYVTTKTGTPDNMGVVIVADNGNTPNISGGVPVDIGGGSPTLVTLANAAVTTGVNTFVFTNAFTPTAGTKYWFVLYPLTGGGSGWSASHRYILSICHASTWEASHELSATSADTGSTWTKNNGSLSAIFSVLDASDNYLATRAAAVIGSTTTSVSPTNATNPDEYGVSFTVPVDTAPNLLGYKYFYRALDAATSDHTVNAYSDPLGTPALIESVTVDVSVVDPVTTSSNKARLFSSSHALTAGDVIAITQQVTGAGACQVCVLQFASQAAKEAALLFRDFKGVVRQDGTGVFTEQNDRLYSYLPIIEWVGLAGVSGGDPGVSEVVVTPPPKNFGPVPLNSVLPVRFSTFGGSVGASITATGIAVTGIEVYKGVSMTQRASDAGYALLDTDGTDLAGVTGIHGFSIDTSDDTDVGFYTAGSFYEIVVVGLTVSGKTVNFVAGTFFLMGGSFASTAEIATATVAEFDANSTTRDIIEEMNNRMPPDPADQSLLIAATDAITTLIGTPAVSVSADIAAVKSDTATAVTQTAAAAIRADVGLASANLDTQLAAIAGFVDTETSAAALRAALGLGSANLDTQLAAIAAFVDTEVAAIKAKTDLIPGSPAATGDIPSTAAITAAVLGGLIGDGTITAKQALQIILATTSLKATGQTSTNPKFFDTAGTREVVNATTDGAGNRSAVVLNPA